MVWECCFWIFEIFVFSMEYAEEHWNQLRKSDLSLVNKANANKAGPLDIAAKAVLPVGKYASLCIIIQSIKTIKPIVSLNDVLVVMLASVE